MARSKTNASEWFPGAAERDKRDRPAGLGGWGDRTAGTQGGLGGKSDGLLKHWEPSAKSWRLTALIQISSKSSSFWDGSFIFKTNQEESDLQ